MKLTTSIFVLTLTASAAIAQSGIGPIDAARHAASVSSNRTAETNQVLNGQQKPATPANASTVSTSRPSAATGAAVAKVPGQAVAAANAHSTKPAASTSAKPAVAAAKPALTPGAKSGAAVKPVDAKAKPANAVKKPASVAVTSEEPAGEKAGEKAAPQPEMASRANRRDPFISIIRTDRTGGAQCSSGKKCLVIGDIILRGVVKSPTSVIAVVENPQKKTYFLRENDPVFNGEVVKITSDSVVFHEQVTDRAGRVSTREITKHLNARPIA